MRDRLLGTKKSKRKMDTDRYIEAASKYRPTKVKVLLVAEAPPGAINRYFYFEDVKEHDWPVDWPNEGALSGRIQEDEGRTPAQEVLAEALSS